MARIGHDFPPRGLNFRIKIEECFDAGTQLRFDVFLAAFQHVHGDVGFAPIFQHYRRLIHFYHFAFRQQPHSVDQRKVRHNLILTTACVLVYNPISLW